MEGRIAQQLTPCIMGRKHGSIKAHDVNQWQALWKKSCRAVQGSADAKCQVPRHYYIPRPSTSPQIREHIWRSTAIGSIPTMVQSDKIPEADHSINTVQKKGAAVSHSSGGKIPCVQCTRFALAAVADALQISQTCLVSRRRMVLTAGELEGKYSGLRSCYSGHYRDGMEYQCGEGGQVQDAGTR